MRQQKFLERRLAFSEQTTRELRQQLQYSNQLALSAYECLSSPKDARKNLKKSSPSTWIGGSWLAPSEEVLAPAEKMWQGGNAQGALILLDPVLRRHDISLEEIVNARLLSSAILRSHSDHPRALKHAEDALTIARDAGAYMLTSKAEFHRGLCFLKQNLYAQAHWCLLLASHLENHDEHIEANRSFAEEHLRNSPFDDPGSRNMLDCP